MCDRGPAQYTWTLALLSMQGGQKGRPQLGRKAGRALGLERAGDCWPRPALTLAGLSLHRPRPSRRPPLLRDSGQDSLELQIPRRWRPLPGGGAAQALPTLVPPMATFSFHQDRSTCPPQPSPCGHPRNTTHRARPGPPGPARPLTQAGPGDQSRGRERAGRGPIDVRGVGHQERSVLAEAGGHADVVDAKEAAARERDVPLRLPGEHRCSRPRGRLYATVPLAGYPPAEVETLLGSAARLCLRAGGGA